MDFKLTEEQELLLKSIDDMMARDCPESYIAECDNKHEYTYKFDEVLAKSGLTFLGVPEEYGGTPADVLTLALVSERIVYNGIYGGLSSMLYVKDILDFGNPEQKKIILEIAKTGQPAFGVAITEPGAGSDDASMKTTATKQTDGTVILNGQKTFCSKANLCPYILVFTRDLSLPNPHKAVSMWLFPTDTPGVTVKQIDKVVDWTIPTCDVFLDDVRIPQACLLGQENMAFYHLMKNFEVERVLACTMSLGSAEAAFNDAAHYATQREQFGAKIGTFQQVQLMLAEMAIKIENMKNMVYKLAWKVDNHLPVIKDTAMAKYYCARSAFEVCDDAMQIFGGYGVTSGIRVQRFWRDTRLARIGGGTDQIMVNILGKLFMKEYA
jgi:crotonobetainyl-CoA dehydrogenase